MSATTVRSSASSVPSHNHAYVGAQSSRNLAPFVDLQQSPYAHVPAAPANDEHGNPVADLIPDEVYQLLRSNDLISEKGVRDYMIRRTFKAMRENKAIKSSEALERLQAIYPYLQIDTIRKIIYRIGPGSNRKMMF